MHIKTGPPCIKCSTNTDNKMHNIILTCNSSSICCFCVMPSSDGDEFLRFNKISSVKSGRVDQLLQCNDVLLLLLVDAGSIAWFEVELETCLFSSVA